MDTKDLLSTAGLTTSGVAILAIIYKVWGFIKGRRLVSDCCGKRVSFGVNTETITPSHSTGVLVETHHEVVEVKHHAPLEEGVVLEETRSRGKSVVKEDTDSAQHLPANAPPTGTLPPPPPPSKLERQIAQPSSVSDIC